MPIIPVPESVLNSSGNSQIHDSFLFPINVTTNQITWVWESIEESKASYIFSTLNSNFENGIQKLFDYITGDTINKRQTLIYDSRLAQSLLLKKRILHEFESNWKSEIRKIENS